MEKKKFGEQLKEQRSKTGLKEMQFAAQAGIALDTLRRLERGGNPTLYVIDKLQKFLDYKFEI